MTPAIVVMVIWAASGSFHSRPMVMGGFGDMAQCEHTRALLEKKHENEKPPLIIRCAEMSPL